MRNLLRADRIRFRGRRDFWAILVLVAVIAAVSYLGGYRSTVEDPPPFDVAQYEQMLSDPSFFGDLTPEEAEQQRVQFLADARSQDDQMRIDHEAQQQVRLRLFAFPQSVTTILGDATVPFLALVLVMSMAIGDEFRLGTLRTSLLAASDRRRFLVARLISVMVIAIGLLATIVALGALLPLILAVSGAEMVPTPGLDGPSTLFLVGADLLVVLALLTFAAAITLLLRSGTLTVILLLLYGLIEVFVSNLPSLLGPGNPLAAVPQFFLVNSIRLLQIRLGIEAGSLAAAESPTPTATIDFGWPAVATTVVGAAIVVGWTLLFLAVADRRIRSMDVTE